MGAIGQYINVKTTATGEVRQVNLYSSLDDVGGQGKEFAYGGVACWAAVSEDAEHENKSNWAYKAANGVTMQVLTHWEEAVSEFNMYNWAWANYQAVTGQNHVTLTAFDNASALPNAAQLKGVTNAANAFFNCRNLTDVSPFAGLCAYGDAVSFSRMFQLCANLSNLSPLNSWNTVNVTSIDYMFGSCGNIISLDGLANWNVENVTNMISAFYNCFGINNISGLANWNTGKTMSFSDFLRNCQNLTDITPLANWNTSGAKEIRNIFMNCQNLTDITPLANWDTSSVTNIYQSFYNCRSLTTLDALANWDTGNVTSMAYTFHNCQNLTCAVIPDTLASSVNCTLANAFRNCTNLQGDIWFYGNNVNNAANCFNGCNAYAKNIHAYRDTRTWNSFYNAMGNSTHNDLWNADLVEI